MNKLIRKIKSFSFVLLAFGFFMSTAITSCGNKRGQQEAEFQNEDQQHPDRGTDFPSGSDNERSSDNPHERGSDN